jgi:hypothetical protein
MKLIFERQIWHYALLLILLVTAISVSRTQGFLSGQLWGITTAAWFYLAIGAAIAHQVYVWFCWRTQLHYSLLTRFFGQRSFVYYAVVFLVLMTSRLVFIIGLAISSRSSLSFSRLALNTTAIIMALLVAYLLYSVVRYFSLRRALGIDHFDPSYRFKPLVREGIFRFTGNGMYVFGLLILWIPGLVMASAPALLAALFSHLYIWVHYYTLEKPDMNEIYGG